MTESPQPPQPDPIEKPAPLPRSLFDGKVVRGKDGWLFLDFDTNEIMRQQRGELLFTDEQLSEWQSLLEERVRWLAGRGVPYYFLVPPNPGSVHSDKLPFEIAAGTQTPITQLIKYLRAAGSSVPMVYPLKWLTERRDEGVYAKTNTHWTDLGAFVAYEMLMDLIGDSKPVRRLVEANLTLTEDVRPGDLGEKVKPTQSSRHVNAVLTNPTARMLQDNRVMRNGRRIDYECPDAEGTVCLVLGDSFAHTMLPFLAESFSRVVFGYLPTLDRELVLEIRPDIVVSIMNERFLIRVPVDAGAKTLAECAAEKRASGAVHAPRVIHGTRVDSPLPEYGN